MKIEIYIVDLCWKSEKKIWVLIILSLEEKNEESRIRKEMKGNLSPVEVCLMFKIKILFLNVKTFTFHMNLF